MKKTNSMLIFAVLIVVGTGLQAINPNASGGSESGFTDNTLIFGRGGDSLTLDPALLTDGESAKVCEMLYDTLIQYRDETTELAPALAETWESSADGLTWTFYLRQGVQFHDGTPFGADAVVFSLSRANTVFRDFHAEFINQIIALDAYTVQIQLKKSYAPFISTLAGTSYSIVSPDAVQRYGDNFGDVNAVGTGPFKFVQWDKGDSVVLEANENHWAGRPALDRFIFRSIPDNSVRLMELQAGNIHAMEFPNPEEIPVIEADPLIELVTQSSLNVGYLAMNFDKPPFDNLKVRLAINHAINKPDIIERLYQGTGIPAKGPIPPTLWSYDEAIQDYEYNPELARQLLAEAGFPDGFETTLWALPVPRPYIPDGMALAEALQSDLREVGIEAAVETFDWGTYIDKTKIGEHDMAMLGWIVSEGDPDSFFYYLLSKTYAEKPAFNIAFYRSDEMQDILDRARTSTNRGERTELYRQAQAIFHRDAPWVPLAHAQRLLVVNWRVKNLRLAPTGWKYLRSLSLEEDTTSLYVSSLSQGLNTISIPLQPDTPMNARTLSDMVGATAVITLDAANQRFVGWTPDAPHDGFPIEGANGYIVNLPEAREVAFVGKAWANQAQAAAAPSLSHNADTWAFVVSGYLESSRNLGGYLVTVQNLTTGDVMTGSVRDGYFAAATANLARQSVVNVGDTLEVTVTDTTGEMASKPVVFTVTRDALLNAVLPVMLDGVGVPKQTMLLQNYPNPFNPETWIPYHLSEAGDVSITIYDTVGQRVRILSLGFQSEGYYQSRSLAAYWDGRNDLGERVPSGIYSYHLSAGDYTAAQRMAIVK